MISHALKLILDKCPHYPTLLTLLLDVTVTFRLIHESEQLLHCLCVAALRKKLPKSDPKVISSNLVDPSSKQHFLSLYHKCCFPEIDGQFPLLTHRTYTTILVSAGYQVTPNLRALCFVPDRKSVV